MRKAKTMSNAKKKIEQLIPLFIGQKVLIDSGEYKLIGAEGTLVGKTNSRALVQYAGNILHVEFVDIRFILTPHYVHGDKDYAEYIYTEASEFFKSGTDVLDLISEGIAVNAETLKNQQP